MAKRGETLKTQLVTPKKSPTTSQPVDLIKKESHLHLQIIANFQSFVFAKAKHIARKKIATNPHQMADVGTRREHNKRYRKHRQTMQSQENIDKPNTFEGMEIMRVGGIHTSIRRNSRRRNANTLDCTGTADPAGSRLRISTCRI